MVRFPKFRARAPLRLGLAGGGTDILTYSNEFGGAVLNATIDRFAFASVLPRTDDQVVFRADDIGITEQFEANGPFSSPQLALHAAVYQRMIRDYNDGHPVPLTLATTVDAPPGSGLGSSSALVVAIVDAFRVALNASLGPYDVAGLAYEIERQDVGLAGGKQDQYAAAFGGVNYIEFPPGGQVIVNPLRISDAILTELESSILICFTGRSRQSAKIIERQTAGMNEAQTKTIEAMHQLKCDAIAMKQALLRGDIEEMAELLSSSWRTKQLTAQGISNAWIDELMALALAKGALGGKISGAGGGGFLTLLVHPEHRFTLMEALNSQGATATPVMFTPNGCQTWCY